MKIIKMNKSILLSLTFIFFGIKLGLCQKEALMEIVPKGYLLFEQYKGDLNGDGKEDYVLLIKDTKKEDVVVNRFSDTVDRNRRGIIVVFDTGKRYEKIVENKDCFLSENEDGGVYMPPELWIDIKDGKLKIHYGHGRYGYWVYIFKYLESNFKLIAYEASENQGPRVLYKTKIDFRNRKKIISKNVSDIPDPEEEEFETTHYKIQISELLKLSEIKNFSELNISKY